MYITCYCFCHLNMAVNFNIYSIKAKRAVNRKHCVVQIVIGTFPETDIVPQ